jgi:hypothetical protein
MLGIGELVGGKIPGLEELVGDPLDAPTIATMMLAAAPISAARTVCHRLSRNRDRRFLPLDFMFAAPLATRVKHGTVRTLPL